MTSPPRIWIWPNQSATGVIAWGAGCYRAEPHRPLDRKDGPTGEEYVPVSAVNDAYEVALDIIESQNSSRGGVSDAAAEDMVARIRAAMIAARETPAPGNDGEA